MKGDGEERKIERKKRKIQKYTRMAPTSIFPVLQAMYLRGEDSEESLLGSRGGDEGKDTKLKGLLAPKTPHQRR